MVTQLSVNRPLDISFLRKVVNFNDTGIGSSDTVAVGVLPAGCEIIDCQVNIQTAFNAGTTNVLTVGTSSGSDADIVAAADVAEGSTGVWKVTRGVGLSVTTDTTIYAKYTQTGGAATTGKARIVITYARQIGG